MVNTPQENFILHKVTDKLRYLESKQSVLQDYLRAETRHAEEWMRPLAAVQEQLHTEMVQNTPNEEVCRGISVLDHGWMKSESLDDCVVPHSACQCCRSLYQHPWGSGIT